MHSIFSIRSDRHAKQVRPAATRSAWLAAVAAAVLLSACASKKVDPASEAFDDTTTFTHNYESTPEQACEAARRALLSQAYIVTTSSPQAFSARKHFQQNREHYYEIEFNVTCVSDRGNTSTVFANAVQQLYTLRKTNTSASVGVSVLGTLSMPIGSSDDSLVKIGSLTLTKPGLYNRFFDLVQNYLVVDPDTDTQPQPPATTDKLNPSPSETAQPPAAASEAPAAPAPTPEAAPQPSSD